MSELPEDLKRLFLQIAPVMDGNRLGVAINPTEGTNESILLRELEKRGLIEKIASGMVLTYDGLHLYRELSGSTAS